MANFWLKRAKFWPEKGCPAGSLCFCFVLGFWLFMEPHLEASDHRVWGRPGQKAPKRSFLASKSNIDFWEGVRFKRFSAFWGFFERSLQVLVKMCFTRVHFGEGKSGTRFFPKAKGGGPFCGKIGCSRTDKISKCARVTGIHGNFGGLVRA